MSKIKHWKVTKRTADELRFNHPITWKKHEKFQDDLFWQDLYLFPDVISGDRDVIYIFDTYANRVYWGYVGDKVFEREPDEDVELELMEERFGSVGSQNLLGSLTRAVRKQL